MHGNNYCWLLNFILRPNILTFSISVNKSLSQLYQVKQFNCVE